MRVCAKSNHSSESRYSTRCDDIEPAGNCPWNSEIPTIETNPKNPMRRAEQEREDCGHAVYRNWCVVCVRGRCVEKHIQVEPLKEEEKERTQPSLSAFSCVDKFPIPIRRDDGQSQTKVTCCERKDSIPCLISVHFLSIGESFL